MDDMVEVSDLKEQLLAVRRELADRADMQETKSKQELRATKEQLDSTTKLFTMKEKELEAAQIQIAELKESEDNLIKTLKAGKTELEETQEELAVCI